MNIDFLSSFGSLDELVQIIYQGAYRFVVLSSVDESKWSIHLGLSGSEGRWWRGSWTQDDVHNLVGPNPSSILLDTFAEKLADSLTGGDLSITDWSADRNAEIKLTFGPTSKRPLHVPLVELTSEEAASHATDVFLEIALQAKTRNFRLHPPAYAATSTRSFSPPRNPNANSNAEPRNDHAQSPPRKRIDPPKPSPVSNADGPTRPFPSTSSSSLKPEPRQTVPSNPIKKATPSTSQSKPAPPKRNKGASLANPSKKARKYQALEFASDDDE
ncbi:hypothetical protein ONZ45_g2092 [Pleurotus djamor]|nr:hypothetical protein ONZ45_g2092 [Pleurotus djamor]